MRKRLSYANVTATLALVFAMSGGAMAANHYLITSTKQINPKVLKKLNGQDGQADRGDRSRRVRPDLRVRPGKEGLPDKDGQPGKKGQKAPMRRDMALRPLTYDGPVETGIDVPDSSMPADVRHGAMSVSYRQLGRRTLPTGVSVPILGNGTRHRPTSSGRGNR